MNHLLDFKNIDKTKALTILETTLKIQNGEKYNINGHSVIKFDEPSTRTKISFTIAAQKLGLDLIMLDDITSSKTKGESLDHEIQTLLSLWTRRRLIVDFEEITSSQSLKM